MFPQPCRNPCTSRYHIVINENLVASGAAKFVTLLEPYYVMLRIKRQNIYNQY